MIEILPGGLSYEPIRATNATKYIFVAYYTHLYQPYTAFARDEVLSPYGGGAQRYPPIWGAFFLFFFLHSTQFARRAPIAREQRRNKMWYFVYEITRTMPKSGTRT